MQKLAGIITESQINQTQERMGIFDDIDADLENEPDPVGYLEEIIKYCQQLIQFENEDLE